MRRFLLAAEGPSSSTYLLGNSKPCQQAGYGVEQRPVLVGMSSHSRAFYPRVARVYIPGIYIYIYMYVYIYYAHASTALLIGESCRWPHSPRCPILFCSIPTTLTQGVTRRASVGRTRSKAATPTTQRPRRRALPKALHACCTPMLS